MLLAVQKGRFRVLEYLLENGADPNMMNQVNTRSLCSTIITSCYLMHASSIIVRTTKLPPIMQRLIRKAARVNTSDNVQVH